jgi:hypothetical protein
MPTHTSDLSKAEDNLVKLKDNAAVETLMEERWLKAREKVEEKILSKKKEAREKEAAEAKRIADEAEAEKATTSVSFGWIKVFLGTAVGAGMLYALWCRYCRPKRGSEATGASAPVVTSIKPNDGSGYKVGSSTKPSGGKVFNRMQTNYGRSIDTATMAGAVAGAAIMKQTTAEQQTQKGQRKRKQNLASVGANNNHGSVNTTAFDPEVANEKMWVERRRKIQEKEQGVAQRKQQQEAAKQQEKAIINAERQQKTKKAAKEKQEAIAKAEQQGKAEEVRKKEEAAAEAKRVTDETSKQQKMLEAIKKVEQRKQSEPNEPQEKIEEDGRLQEIKLYQNLGVHEDDGGGNDGETDVDALSWDQRLNAALDSVQDVLAGEVEKTWV